MQGSQTTSTIGSEPVFRDGFRGGGLGDLGDQWLRMAAKWVLEQLPMRYAAAYLLPIPV